MSFFLQGAHSLKRYAGVGTPNADVGSGGGPVSREQDPMGGYRPPRPGYDLYIHAEAAETALMILTDRMAAIESKLDALITGVKTMGTTLEQQIQQATAQIRADMGGLATDLTAIQEQIAALQAQITAGAQVTQADVDSLNEVAASVDQLKSSMDNMANPVTPAP